VEGRTLCLSEKLTSEHAYYKPDSNYSVHPQICIKYSPDAVPPIHDESYHVATDKDPPSAVLAASSAGLFLATIYNQSQLAERKHVARYWSISTVPVSAQPPPLVITTKLAAAILVVAVVSS